MAGGPPLGVVSRRAGTDLQGALVGSSLSTVIELSEAPRLDPAGCEAVERQMGDDVALTPVMATIVNGGSGLGCAGLDGLHLWDEETDDTVSVAWDSLTSFDPVDCAFATADGDSIRFPDSSAADFVVPAPEHAARQPSVSRPEQEATNVDLHVAPGSFEPAGRPGHPFAARLESAEVRPIAGFAPLARPTARAQNLTAAIIAAFEASSNAPFEAVSRPKLGASQAPWEPPPSERPDLERAASEEALESAFARGAKRRRPARAFS